MVAAFEVVEGLATKSGCCYRSLVKTLQGRCEDLQREADAVVIRVVDVWKRSKKGGHEHELC